MSDWIKLDETTFVAKLHPPADYNYGELVGAMIWVRSDGATLGINGYRFHYPNAEEAKDAAIHRIKNNAGIYLPFTPTYR